MTSTLITVAPAGVDTATSSVPTLPTTLDKLVAEAKACQAAGASLIHIHVRDAGNRLSLDPRLLRETVAALRQETDLIIQLSPAGLAHHSLDERLAVLDAEPDSCSLTCGTVNSGDGVFLNPWPFIVKLFERARDAHVVPEFELYDLGHVQELRRLLDTCGLPWGGKVHCNFILGAPWEMPATVEMLVTGVDALPPQVTSWSATGVGRGHLPVIAAALALGGHVRVGMEDTRLYDGNRPVRSNAELVERAVRLATELQRPPMSLADARTMLGL
jgi:3-keto-5-aminohexanoate cleavage enzyme